MEPRLFRNRTVVVVRKIGKVTLFAGIAIFVLCVFVFPIVSSFVLKFSDTDLLIAVLITGFASGFGGMLVGLIAGWAKEPPVIAFFEDKIYFLKLAVRPGMPKVFVLPLPFAVVTATKQTQNQRIYTFANGIFKNDDSLRKYFLSCLNENPEGNDNRIITVERMRTPKLVANARKQVFVKYSANIDNDEAQECKFPLRGYGALFEELYGAINEGRY